MVCGTLLLGVKFSAYALTHSTAVLSDALESIVNVAASAFALYTVWIAAQPADESHPYGHGKAEAFSAGFEGGLIALAGAAILWEAVPTLWAPVSLERLDLGLMLVAAAGAVNLALGRFLIRTGKRTGSVALEADGHHLISDSVTTAGVLIGLGIVQVTGLAWVDPLIAILVAAHLFCVGTRLLHRAVANLMDQADPAVLALIAGALRRARRSEWIEVHKLRSWRTGDRHHVDFHLTLPRFWDIQEGHRSEREVSSLVRGVLDDDTADISVHVDPCVAACCPHCGYEPCPVRAAPFTGPYEWNDAALARSAGYQRAQEPETTDGAGSA